jgi:RND superfamily putative drug exporter
VLARLARLSFRRRRLVLAVWAVLFLGLGAAQGALGAAYRTDFSLPDTESKRGLDLLSEAFPGAGGGGFEGQIVVRTAGSVTDPAVASALRPLFDAVAAAYPGIRVVSPFQPEGQAQVAAQGPQAGRIAYARVEFPAVIDRGQFTTITSAIKPALEAARTALGTQGQVELGGEAFAEFAPPSSEIFGIVFAMVILLVAFGSVLAMGLPIGVALFGIGTGAGIITLLSHVMSMPDFTLTLAAMIGLGVGIDYALFIVTRFREGLHDGLEPEDAAVVAIDTAGRAVIFAGITVVISLLGMMLMQLSFVRGLAIGASTAVLMTMLASVTLLPALLGFAGRKVELTRYRGLVAVAFIALALLAVGLKVPAAAAVFAALAVVTLAVGRWVPGLRTMRPYKQPKAMRDTIWYRWSRFVEHRPWPVLAVGVVVLGALAFPVLSLRLGNSDTGNYPTDSTTRRAYDLLSDGFGPGSNGPLLLIARTPAGTSPEVLRTVTEAVAADPGVAFASPARPNADGTAAQWFVVPRTAPQDEATTELVNRLRDDTLRSVESSTGLDVIVTGSSAVGVDFSEFLAARLPLFIGVVLALSFLLLMAVFRSILVPLKAVLMNLLSIGAAYGVVVMVFQWGWLGPLVGVGRAGPIDPWAPMMLFAIVFGLSMDYEVFLLSRMREEFDRHRDNAAAVADGLASTARVITAAAAIMVFVFGSFLLEPNRQIKLFGVGLGVAVLLDATVVRMLLVPATMRLLGARNWWMPAWLDRVLPKLNVEGHAAVAPPTAPQPDREVVGTR